MFNRFVFIFVLLLLISQKSFAVGYAAGIGTRKTYVDALVGTDEAKSSFHMGGLIWVKLYDSISLRTGVFYTQRMFQTVLPSTEVRDHNFTFIDVPFTLSYQASPGASFFIGAVLGTPLDDMISSSQGGTIRPVGLKENIFPLTAGVTMSMTDHVRLELFYEQENKILYQDVQNVRAVGATLMYFFGDSN